MKRVYQVTLQHKRFPTDTHKPWVIARSADEASKKVWKYANEHMLPVSQTEVIAVVQMGTVDVE